MIICECGKICKTCRGLKNHKFYCSGDGTKRQKTRGKGNKLCLKCNKIIHNHIKQHFDVCDGKGPKRFHKSEFPRGKGRKLSDEHKKKIGISLKGKSSHKHSDEFKEKQSQNILRRYESGWMPKAGRCKKIKYNSPIAGDILIDGTWEFRVVQYLDLNKINWKRNTKRFEYFDVGKIRHYTPDFYLIDFDCYIEVKGYETELDRCKWSQFIGKLEIWNKKKLLELNIL